MAMTERELLRIINQAEREAVLHNGEYMALNERFLERYLGDPQGDEVEGQSQVISTDCFDIVESDMPAHARTFLGPQNILEFKALNVGNPQAVQEAEEKTAYVNWLIKHQPNAFRILFGWMKDAEIQKIGVVKFRYVETEEIKVMPYRGMSPEELAVLEQDFEEDKDVDSWEITGQDEEENEVEYTLKMTTRTFETVPVPVENFLISRNAANKDEAEFIGDFGRMSRGELIAMGLDEEDVMALPAVGSGEIDDNSSMKQIRFRQQGGEDQDSDVQDPISQMIEFTESYPLVDFDGDNIAERRHVFKAGNKIFINEPFEVAPYAINSAYLMPHNAIGRSRVEVTEQTQRVKTALERQMLDNVYRVNNGRVVVNDDVTNVDDLLSIRMNGIVRTSGDPRMAVAQLETPFVGDKALLIMQYMDSAQSKATGNMMTNQGLDSDALYRETATRFEGMKEVGQAKVELIARCFAETGWKELFEGYAWMVAHYQNDKTEVMILGKPMTIDPRKWRHKHYVSSIVGLAAGDDETVVGNMAGLLTIHNQLKATGSLLTDDLGVYNTLKKMVNGMGFEDVTKFFNNPEQPDSQLLAQNEMLMNAVDTMQQQIQGLSNPLAEAELVKREGDIAIAQGKQQIEAAKFQDSREKWQAELQEKATKDASDAAFKATELEVESGVDIPGSTV